MSHPTAGTASLPDKIGEALFRILTTAPAETKARRAAMFQKWVAHGDAIRAAEDDLIEAAHDDVKEVICRPQLRKRPILARDLAKAAGYPHPEVFEQQLRGFPLVGVWPRNEAFPEQEPEPTNSLEWLSQQAPLAQLAAEAELRASDDGIAEKVYAKTREELDAGFLRGPFSPAELSSRLGPN